MKNNGMTKRFMAASIIIEVLYIIAAAVIIFIRPQFWNSYVLSFIMGVDEVPPKVTDAGHILTVFGSAAVFFLLWGLLKVFGSKGKDPVPIGILTLIYLPVSVILQWKARSALLERLSRSTETVREYAFYSVHFNLLNIMANISLISVVFLLMAYAASRQRYLDNK